MSTTRSHSIFGARGINKSFGRESVLHAVSLDLQPGDVLGLVGHNGSGKSTLLKILSGILTPDSGQILFKENPVEFRSSADAINLGIRMLPQAVDIFPLLTAMENIFIGQELTTKRFGIRLLDYPKMRKSAKSLLETIGAGHIDPRFTADILSGGQKQSIALARLVANPSAVLIFDEPMASLGIEQTAQVKEIIHNAKQRGIGVIFASHQAEDIMEICTHILALKRGIVDTTGPVEQFSISQVEQLLFR